MLEIFMLKIADLIKYDNRLMHSLNFLQSPSIVWVIERNIL